MAGNNDQSCWKLGKNPVTQGCPAMPTGCNLAVLLPPPLPQPKKEIKRKRKKKLGKETQ